jgi:hypothetical protein
MIAAIERDEVESVYLVHTSRLTRDQSLIDGMVLGQLFKQHNIILCLPTMRLNLRDSMHMRLFRQEVERAADEIELLKMRLGGPKRQKALSGRWDGRGVPLGYIVDLKEGSPTFERYLPYEPHAVVVRAIFQAFIAHGTPTLVARALRNAGVIVPDFPPEMGLDEHRGSLLRSTNPSRIPGGYAITPSLARSIVTNPVYTGIWLVNGQVAKAGNHAALIDPDTFYAAQDVLARYGKGGIRVRRAVQMLVGLIYCDAHDTPRRMTSAVVDRARGRYQCDDRYRNGFADAACTVVDARLLDEPIAEVVLDRCSFHQYADAVLGQLEGEYDQAVDQARQHKRDLARLEAEIETLKQNLATTRTPEQAQIIFDLIDQRTAKKKELADARTSPMGKMLTAAQVASVRAFLANMRTGWAKQPTNLKNELLALLLDRVTVISGSDTIQATITWRSGETQYLVIDRPVGRRGGKTPWTDEDRAWLRDHYPTAPKADIEARFPDRHRTAIRKMAGALGVRRDRTTIQPNGHGVPWTEAEDTAIRRYFAGTVSYADLLEALPGRTWGGIVVRRKRLDLPAQVERVFYCVVDGAGTIVGSADPSRRVARRSTRAGVHRGIPDARPRRSRR